MQSIVFVGYIIVYVFMFNIIIKMQLPPNQIYVVGIAVFFIGVLTSYMSQGFDNSDKILNNVMADISNRFEKRFSQEDSVIIFILSKSCKTIKYGYAKNADKDLVIVT